jgi:hypothetical protein
MSLLVTVATTVGLITWPTLKNSPPDFTGITASTGIGRYELMFANGMYFVDVVEEA